MLTKTHTQTSVARFAGGVLSLLFFLGFSASAFGQTVSELQDGDKQPAVKKAPSSIHQPVASVYKEVKIGTTADEVRELLGKAKIDDKDGFFYDRDSELVQIRLDENGKVRLIAVTYAAKSLSAPKYADIFGDEPATAKPDGSIYKLVRYPEAGYWVAYSKTGGSEPTVTVTMQKL
jgi:hypothetical protein